MSELLGIIDEQVDVDQKDEWKITDDATADWWIERKQEELKDIERVKTQIQEKIDFYKQKMISVEKQEEFVKESMNSKLIEYFESIPAVQKKRTKTLVKYQLPTGTLQKKFKSPTYIRNDEELLKYAKENAPDCVQIKKSLEWVKFKKRTEIVDGQVVDSNTGEILPIRLEEQAPVFEVKI